jgi:hypothetical protein
MSYNSSSGGSGGSGGSDVGGVGAGGAGGDVGDVGGPSTTVVTYMLGMTFENISDSMLFLFALLMQNNWHVFFLAAKAAHQSDDLVRYDYFYFYSYIVIGNMLLLNFLQSLFLEVFGFLLNQVYTTMHPPHSIRHAPCSMHHAPHATHTIYALQHTAYSMRAIRRGH